MKNNITVIRPIDTYTGCRMSTLFWSLGLLILCLGLVSTGCSGGLAVKSHEVGSMADVDRILDEAAVKTGKVSDSSTAPSVVAYALDITYYGVRFAGDPGVFIRPNLPIGDITMGIGTALDVVKFAGDVKRRHNAVSAHVKYNAPVEFGRTEYGLTTRSLYQDNVPPSVRNTISQCGWNCEFYVGVPDLYQTKDGNSKSYVVNQLDITMHYTDKSKELSDDNACSVKGAEKALVAVVNAVAVPIRTTATDTAPAATVTTNGTRKGHYLDTGSQLKSVPQ